MTLVWVALLVGLVAIVASIVLLVVRTVELWRTLRSFFSAVGGGLDELSRRADALSSRESTELKRLDPSVERLRRSSAQLAVLRTALVRVREQASGVLVLFPRK